MTELLEGVVEIVLVLGALFACVLAFVLAVIRATLTRRP